MAALSPRLQAIVDALPLRPGLRVIEVGCGPGAAARAVADRVGPDGHVLAVDRSARAIALLARSAADLVAAGRLTARQVAAEDLELDAAEAPYDLAFAVRVGAFDGRDPPAGSLALARLGRALVPGGRLFVDGGDPLREVVVPGAPPTRSPRGGASGLRSRRSVEGGFVNRKLDSDDLIELRKLVKGSDSIELKLTLPPSNYRGAARALGFDPLEAQIRQVFFFDTPELDLNRAGVVARARRIQGRDHDSVVKLRPVVPGELPDALRRLPEFVVEVDVLPGGYVCSASLKGALPPPAITQAIEGGKPLRKLFSKDQRAFFGEHAPDGLTLDDLSVLGPIFVLKLKTVPQAFSRKLVAEMWLYPDGSRVVELSTKCLPGQGFDTAIELRDFLAERGIDTDAEQQTKTKTALEFFSAELRSTEPALA